MFIQGTTRRVPSRTGILHARPSSDKQPLIIYEAETLPHPLPGFAIALKHLLKSIPDNSSPTHREDSTATTTKTDPLLSSSTVVHNNIKSLLRVVFGVSSSVELRRWSLTVETVEKLSERVAGYCLVVVVAVSTVRSLYAGTLATIWTTAPRVPPQRRRSPSAVHLAAVLLVCLATTLTIAARCYASTNATHPNLVQLQPPPPSTSHSPIDNSNNINNNARTHASSSSSSSSSLLLLALSRLSSTRSPHHHNHQLVRISDTSVIVINSKKSLHNQNSNRFRTKRELRPSPVYNYATRDSSSNPSASTTTTATTGKANRVFGLVSSAANNINRNSSVGARIRGTNSTTRPQDPEQHRQDRRQFDEDASSHSRGTEQPMPPVHDHGNASSVSDLGVLVLVLSAIVLTVALGLVTCVLSHYRSVAGEGAADGGTAADPHDAAQTPTTAPMLSVVSAGAAAGVGGMDRLRGGRAARELAATRDRQVRLHAVQTDIAINLPPSIAMPDGEEHPFSSSRLLHLRDPEQESEIHQKCIRPPPNRTVSESESPPPYRSSCAGLLGSSSSSSSTTSSSSSGGGVYGSSGVFGGGGGGASDWSGGSAPLVERCHSMSSSSTGSKRPDGQKTDFLQRTVKIFTGGGKKTAAGGATAAAASHHHHHHQQQPAAPTLPVVNVPTRPRRISNDQNNTTTARPKPSV